MTLKTLHQRKLADFRPYQRWMSDEVYKRKYLLLAAEMGLGKTAAVLWAIRRLLDEFAVRRVLIIAPINVARDTWPEEIETWDFSRCLSYSVIVGTPEERLKAANDNTEIHIINRENVVWLYNTIGLRRFQEYDMIVYDESSRLGDGELHTKPAQRKDGSFGVARLSGFGALAKARRFADRFIEMSGTPTPQGVKSLWGQVFMLDQGERLGNRKTAFMQRWFVKNPVTKAVKPMDHAFSEITDRTKDVIVSLREEDYLTLPPLVVSDRYVNLEPKIMEKYKRLEREMVLSEHDVEAVNSGVLTNKLLQLANGSIYNDEREAIFLHDYKMQELESIRQEAEGQPLLVFYSFQFDLAAIKKRYPKWRVYGETKNDKNDWNAGRLPALILHPASAGHGLNFQYGGSIAVMYGLNWSMELYLQSIKRLHRSGQTADHVTLHRILARGTEDERVAKRLLDRKADQDSITEVTRVTMETIRQSLRAAA